MKRKSNPALYVQTFSAFGFGIAFVALAFVAHPSNVPVAWLILWIGVVLIAGGVVAVIYVMVRARRGNG